MKRWITTLGAVAMLATVAGATAWSQTVATAGDDPVKADLARQVIEVTGGQRQYDAQVKTLFGAIEKNMSQFMPADQDRLAQAVYADMEVEMLKLTPQMLDLSVHIYAQNYTEPELRDLLAFQRSESGQSIARKGPAIRAQAIAAMMPLVMTMMPAIMHKAADHVCEQNHCTDAQRRIIADSMTKALKGPSS